MTDSKDFDSPTKGRGDTFHSLFKGGMSSIPVVGGLVAEIFNLFIVPPYQKRFERWINMVGEELKELSRSDLVRWKDLEDDERFATVLIQCTQAAIRQHRQEKLALLLNAVSNTARQTSIKEDLQSTFVRYIDELTPTHFVLLTFLIEEEKKLWKLKSYSDLLERFNVDRGVQIGREEFRLFCSDLSSRLLVRFSRHIEEFEGVYDPGSELREGEEKPMLEGTNLGIKLLTFIKGREKNDEKEMGKTKDIKKQSV